MKKENLHNFLYEENKGVKMNKKLLLVAIAAALSVSGAYASDITGVTPNGNTFNINPSFINGDVGYRKYDNFKLDQGDIANLIYQGTKNGKDRDLNAFVNLVKNKVDINGVLNTTRNGNFYNGHAIFITPGGMAIGSSGVLNVGSLSVATPSTSKYNQLTSEFDNKYVKNIDQVSKLKQDSNAPIDVKGKILARSGVDLRGSAVNISGGILNGVTENNVLSSKAEADALFNKLVNTNGVLNANATALNNGSIVLIKASDKEGSGLTVTGTVANNANGGVYLTNAGKNGLVVNGTVSDRNLTRLYNKAGDLVVSSKANLNSDHVVVQNQGAALSLTTGSNVAGNRVEVLNQGTGELTARGTIAGNGAVVVKNFTGSGMELSGTVTNTSGQTAINNEKGALLVNGTINNKGNMGINNRGTGMVISKNATITNTGDLKIGNTGADGMTIVGDVANTGNAYIYNDGGKLSFSNSQDLSKAATVTNRGGNLYIGGRANSTGISIQPNATISNEGGTLAIRNKGTGVAAGTRGLDIQGSVTNTNGTLAINNDSGDMYVSDKVTVKNGNLGIINRKGAGKMELATTGNVTVTDGNANIKNYGMGNMTVNSEINHNGRVNVIANAGALNLGSKVHNNSGVLGNNGGFYAAVRNNGTGMNVTSEFVVDGNGEVLIKNISGEDGLRYAGTINTKDNQAALVNKKGNMTVAGDITTTNAPVIVSNQGEALDVKSSSTLTSGTEGLVINRGSKAGTVNGKLNNVKQYEKLRK